MLDLDWHIFRRFFFSLVFVLDVSLETVFSRLSKRLGFRQKYSVARRIFNSLLGVWIS